MSASCGITAGFLRDQLEGHVELNVAVRARGKIYSLPSLLAKISIKLIVRQKIRHQKVHCLRNEAPQFHFVVGFEAKIQLIANSNDARRSGAAPPFPKNVCRDIDFAR